MRKWRWRVSCTLALAFSLYASPLLAQNHVVSLKMGVIDWSNGIIEAIGIGSPPPNPANEALARSAAKTSAVTAARQNLYEILTGVRIDSGTLIKDLVARSNHILKAIQGFLQKAEVVGVSYKSDGSVQATVAVKLTTPFLEMVLPPSIQTIHPIHQPGATANEKGEVYTGLVLDCRGLKVSPAMVLRILDEDGHEVYGASYVSREHAVRHGMVGYTKDLNAALLSKRVKGKPLIVKGIRTAESGLSEIVISNADAGCLRRAASNLSFLQKCRVTIVLD
jgi:hypothetical protein